MHVVKKKKWTGRWDGVFTEKQRKRQTSAQTLRTRAAGLSSALQTWLQKASCAQLDGCAQNARDRKKMLFAAVPEKTEKRRGKERK